jgi:DNA-binding XRE family transcriptional regulator
MTFTARPVNTEGLSGIAVQSFNEQTFYAAFAADIAKARETIIIQSPFVRLRTTEKWIPLLMSAIARGVIVCAFIQEPTHWHQRNNLNALRPEAVAELKQTIAVFDLMRSIGIHVNVRQGAHDKLIVIDGSTLWTGSLNVFSHYQSSETMDRFELRERALKAITERRFYACADCASFVGLRPVVPEQSAQRLRQLGARLIQARARANCTQAQLAQHLGCQQALLSQVENGKRNVGSQTLIQAGCALDLELMFVPRRLVPLVESIIIHDKRTAAP